MHALAMTPSPSIELQTSAGVRVALPIAGIGARSYAFLIDWHIRTLLALAWMFTAMTIASGGFDFDKMDMPDDRYLKGAFIFVVFIVPWLIFSFYHPLLEIVMKGRTPGKRMAGVRIVAKDGTPATTGALLARNVFRFIDAAPVLYAFGIASAMFTRNNVRIGDLAAGTVLIREEKLDRRRVTPLLQRRGGDVTRLELIADLLDRWKQLKEETRIRLADAVLASYGIAAKQGGPKSAMSHDRHQRLQALLRDQPLSEEQPDPAASDENAAIEAWLHHRAPRWQRIETLLKTMRRGRQRESDDAVELLREYRSVSRDLALSRQVFGAGRVTAHLESLFWRAHDFLNRSPERAWPQLVQLLREDVPRDMRALLGPIRASIGLFFLAAFAGAWLIHNFPELATLVASERMIEMVQQGELWTDGLLNVTPPAVLSLEIMTNNITVTLTAFALGAFYGVGTIYILGLNGFMIGGIFAFTARHDLAGRLFEFVVAHGVVEISIILIAGAAGIRLGEVLARPGHRTRSEAFQDAAAQAGRLVMIGAPFLVGAGIIEGHISPNPKYDLYTRIAVGLGYWVFMLLVLSGRMWRFVGSGKKLEKIFSAKETKSTKGKTPQGILAGEKGVACVS